MVAPKEANKITNATVNEGNGDIAFCFLDNTSVISMLQINAFDKNGELLFKKNIFTGGVAYADLVFDGDLLVVYAGSTQKTLYCFDRTGAEASAKITSEEMEAMTGSFIGWKISIFERSYFLDETLYLYEPPAIFKDRARLSIKSETCEKTIYESP